MSVPPTVRVSVGRDGVLAARTNAGRAPAVGDDVWVERPDGTMEPAEPAMVAAVLGASWRNDRGIPVGATDESWCDTAAVHRASARAPAPARHAST